MGVTYREFVGNNETSKKVCQEERAVDQGQALSMSMDVRTGKGKC